jgi:hypothetical protein
MKNRKLLRINNYEKVFEELTHVLYPFRNKPELSMEFVVEGTLENPLIVLKYPGRKLVERDVQGSNAYKWGNLFDFLVIPYVDGKPVNEREFTYSKMLKDFLNNKLENEEFWELIESVFHYNHFTKEPPQLDGIDPKIFLLVLKWMWIQEDLNYRLRCDDYNSPERYILLNKKGNPTSRGAGRKKFMGALDLAKIGRYSYRDIKKIVAFYG